MFFEKLWSRKRKSGTNRQTMPSAGHGDRRLTMEHLENRALLSVTPIAAQLAVGQSPTGIYASSRTAAAATQYVIIALPAVQSGVQTTIELVALNANGRPANNYNARPPLLTL